MLFKETEDSKCATSKVIQNVIYSIKYLNNKTKLQLSKVESAAKFTRGTQRYLSLETAAGHFLPNFGLLFFCSLLELKSHAWKVLPTTFCINWCNILVVITVQVHKFTKVTLNYLSIPMTLNLSPLVGKMYSIR